MGRFMAAIYDWMMHKSEEACLAQWRSELLGQIGGRVLEVGAGTGANLPYLGHCDQLVLAEPDRHMRERLARHAQVGDGRIIAAGAEAIPEPDSSFDAAVVTFLLCSVDDPARVLAEVRRLLRPGGALVFIEHVAAHDNPKRLRLQRRVEPIWCRLAEGCRLTRDTAADIAEAGFAIETIERASMRKALPFLRPTIRGIARAPAKPAV